MDRHIIRPGHETVPILADAGSAGPPYAGLAGPPYADAFPSGTPIQFCVSVASIDDPVAIHAKAYVSCVDTQLPP